MIELRKITWDNFYKIVKLELHEEQKKFVANNLYSLAQAYVASTNGGIPMPYAIYLDEIPIGFMMLSYEPKDPNEADDEDVYDIWRFMIDKNYQGKGYGKQAISKALEIIKTFPHGPATAVVLSFVPANDGAKNLYASFGFVETGEMNGDEVVMKLVL